MLDKVFVGPRVSKLDTGTPPERVSRVTLVVDGTNAYTAGDDTGRAVEKSVPWATQAMAESVLRSLQGVTYLPFSGEDALLDPAAEIGDGVTAGGVYSTLARADITFDGLYSADIAAPGGDEVEDEYPYKSRAQRQSARELAKIRSSITKTAEAITLRVENEIDGVYGQLQLTSQSLSAEIANTAQGLRGELQLTASSLSGRISTAEGNIGSLQLTATSLSSSIQNAQGNISRIDQRVDSIGLSVDGSSIILTKDGVTVSHSIRAASLHGDIIYLYNNQGQIGAQFNVGNASSAADRCELWARAIMLGTGGGHIFLDSGTATLEVGDYEVQMDANIIPNRANMFTCGSYGFPWRDIYSQDGTISSSDARGKKDVDYDMSRYSGFFDRLRPCSFLRTNGTSGRRHHGFIAQEVRAALAAEGMTGKDFAGYVDWEGGEEYGFGLRYEEMIAMLVYEVQELKKQMEERFSQ